ncbi:CoA pyrophosphatase [Desulfobotulus sp.]|jgi:8-oxo-dGTP pyrophosphatase MutT (NUDIX family)|uniref:NUDIX hydrolase n=1 Tax=Desulfobotulus sp. TaxID=1940337 RepID=UPI002A35D862|nr:CoA pyrophosphatase [Desulfobotulus sp.]MDY0163487.1 CoA pyrophosphatase [Desulfobotulus sp.]
MIPFPFEHLRAGLPQRPGFHYARRYRNTAVLIPLIEKHDGIHLLFEQRADGIRQAGEVCFPGGMMDSEDSDPCQTAIRETVEELGLRPDKIEILGRMDILLTVMGLTVAPVVARVSMDTLDELSPNPDEVARIFTLPLAWFARNPPEIHTIQIMAHPVIKKRNGEREVLLPAEALGLPEHYSRPWGGVRHPVLFWSSPEGMIWGITAEIIQALLRITETFMNFSGDDKDPKNVG